jgi:predicted GNAT family N-acyltransferase
VKLERFAISKNIRGKGAGSQLVRAVLQDIYAHPEYEDQQLYLHSQIDACPLYLKFGFEKVGEMFEECGIQHFEMIKNPQG